MPPSCLDEEIARFDPALDVSRAAMPPSSWYTSGEIAELERGTVFANRWLPVARASALAQPGAVASGCVAAEPWLVARDGKGTLRAFHNTCRHKGNLLLKPGTLSSADELVCGYHGWRYSLDGRLTKAPRIAGIESFDRGAMGLSEMAATTWGWWIFINADIDASWPKESLAPLSDELDGRGWSALVYRGSQSYQLECNWKVFVDNYLDGGYHISSIHPSLDGALDGAAYETTLGDGYSVQRAPAAGKGGDRIGAGAIYAYVYPNLMINRYGDCLESNVVVPLTPNRCRVEYDFFFTRAVSADASRASMAESAAIQHEDTSVCEAVQIGLASRGFDRGRYAPRVEHAEHHFHRLLAADFSRA